MNQSIGIRQIGIPILLLAIIILALIFFFIWKNTNDQPAVTENLQNKIESLPPVPAEPSVVMGYAGQIKSLDLKRGFLQLVTVWGEKNIQFDSSIPIMLTENIGSTATPPPLEITPENTFNSKKLVSRADLKPGDIVSVTSLTNVRGVSMFKASSITIIK